MQGLPNDANQRQSARGIHLRAVQKRVECARKRVRKFRGAERGIVLGRRL